MRRKVERSKVLSTLRGAYEASQAIEDDPTSKEIERSLQDRSVRPMVEFDPLTANNFANTVRTAA